MAASMGLGSSILFEGCLGSREYSVLKEFPGVYRGNATAFQYRGTDELGGVRLHLGGRGECWPGERRNRHVGRDVQSLRAGSAVTVTSPSIAKSFWNSGLSVNFLWTGRGGIVDPRWNGLRGRGQAGVSAFLVRPSGVGPPKPAASGCRRVIVPMTPLARCRPAGHFPTARRPCYQGLSYRASFRKMKSAVSLAGAFLGADPVQCQYASRLRISSSTTDFRA